MAYRLRDLLAATGLALLCLVGGAAGQGADDPAGWPRAEVEAGLPGPDLRFLNHRPAGVRGRVRAAGADLVFGDGEPARFWGANLQASALFRTDPANIEFHARRLAALGFNLVRFHHHDSDWVRPNVFGHRAGHPLRLDPAAMDRLDLWIAALKAEGIYVWLDLHVGRVFTAADGIADFAEIAKGEDRVDVRGFNYVSDSIRARMLDFQRAYLDHLNPHTGLRYAEDPAILAVQLTNENDLTQHFGHRLLPNQQVPAHNARYMALAAAFARDHGLDPGQTWKSWEFGPAKIFLNDLEHRFNAAMIADLRRSGFDGLVSTTSTWGRSTLSALPALTAGSLIDVHAYGGPGHLTQDPRDGPVFLDRVAAAQVAGFPLSVSEWNILGFPAEDRFLGPLRMAASAAYQGWDAPVIYGYAQQPLNGPVTPSSWDIAFDRGTLAMLPAAALLYRAGHVAPAGRTYALHLPAETFYGRDVGADTAPAIRTLHEQGRLVVTLPATPALGWLSPVPLPAGAIPVTDPDLSYLPEGTTLIVSDTGEIRRDLSRGLLSVDTARTQLVAGQLAGDPVALSAITLSADLPLAAVAVQSLDGAPIPQARRLMVSVTARVQPVGETGAVFGVEPLRGTLRVTAPADLVLSDGQGRPLALAGAHRVEAGRHVIDLARLGQRGWLWLEPARP